MSTDPAGGRVPTSTYRVQVREAFDLDAVRDLVPYLDDLGVGWVYLSPLLAAHPGSDHGYDVVDPTRVDPARGAREALERLARVVHERGMGLLVDVVPNHVGVEVPATNPWWWDLLTRGRDSRYAGFFDVDWEAGEGRVRLPVVGDDDLLVSPEGGTAIGHLSLVPADDSGGPEDDAPLLLGYHDHRFPVAPGTAAPGDDPQAVHERQHYRLVGWRTADEEQNYRRFFAVTTLAGVRVEDPDVFESAHAEIGSWFRDGLVDGLRVDHPDGLRDPAGYLDDLAELTGGAYVLVEKILEPGEALPAGWATAGTTGYEVLAAVDRVLVDPAGAEPLDDLDARLRGERVDWPALVRASKRHVASTILHAEVRRIARELTPLVEGAQAPEDPRVVDALVELLAAFDVYRSYLPEGRERLDAAIATVRADRADLGDVLDLVGPVLADPEQAPALRFQQTSGMVMAKGVEDRAFYRWSRLTSLTEVGADPDEFSVDVTDFHEAMAERQRTRSEAMTTLSTHDTKRGEDVRARITAIAEQPGRWAEDVDAVLAAVPALPVDDAGFVNLLLQAAVGAWPIERDRLHAYAEKAMREAAEHTGWTDPAADYESAVHAVVDALHDDPQVRGVVDSAARRLAVPGWSNALAAKLLSLTVPGVPDVYQGSELWEQSLVDPDNRREVDYELRRHLLDEAGPRTSAFHAPRELEDDGRAKLHVVRTALRLRRRHPELFTGYTPLAAHGEAAAHALAFDRGGAISVVTRLPFGLEQRGGWGDTRLTLPSGRWHDLLTDRSVAGDDGVLLAALLDRLPVALLVREDR